MPHSRLTLFNLKALLQSRSQMSIHAMAEVYGVEEDDILPLIQRWVQKGCVEELKWKDACGTSCQDCGFAEVRWYRWVTARQSIENYQINIEKNPA